MPRRKKSLPVVITGSSRFHFNWDDAKSVLGHSAIVLGCSAPWLVIRHFYPDIAGPSTTALISAAASAVVKFIVAYASDTSKNG